MKIRKIFVSLVTAGLALSAYVSAVGAAEISGVKFEDKITVAGKTLVLNGLGVRQILFFKGYAAALYLTEKKTSPEAVQALETPRRIVLHILREKIDPDELGQLFIAGMNKNSTKEQKSKVINQTVKFGEMFAAQEPIKKDEVLTLDWVPGSGTVSTRNGKQIGETLPGAEFYNAVLRIWLGESPVQKDLKKGLLSGG